MERQNNESTVSLRAEVAIAMNSLIDAKKVKSDVIQAEAMQSMLALLAKEPNALGILRKLQTDQPEIVRLSKRSRRLISKAVTLGVDTDCLKGQLGQAVDLAREHGIERITRGNLMGVVSAVKDITLPKVLV